MVTDWGDHGHWQPFPVSYLGFAYGAAVAWCRETNVDLDVARGLDTHVFVDRAGALGGIARDLGNVYSDTGLVVKNASVLALLLLFPDRPMGEGRLAGLTVEGLERAGARVDDVASRLRGVRSERDDARILDAEFRLAADLMGHACRLGVARLTAGAAAVAAIPEATRATLAEELTRIVAEHRRVWRLRNRPGGLSDSAARLESLLSRYK
jgi:hypothetical protein